MLRISLLLTFACYVAARPGHSSGPAYLPVAHDYDHYAYAPTIVGHAVEHYPTAVSHQSQTIVHEKRPYLRPIVDYTPAATFVKAHAPIITKYVAVAPTAHYGYAPAETFYNDWYPTVGSGWDAGLAYKTKGWNGWPLK
ncbi:uncharacterized protein LOC142236869 [Haematobia irritans]|uniref:uncharacterized protein LOC142236869 n=1 Tax=Haematobia irritans TaxID=7368 RepID=UPI003F508D37